MRSHTVSLTEGSITKSIIIFSIPILISNLFQQLYNTVDTMIVGKYAGSIALAAVGSSSALINLLIDFFLGISVGAGILYAMHYGAGDYKGLKKLIDSALLISAGVSVVITAFGIGFSDRLLRIMNVPGEVYQPSKDYFTIYLIGTLPTLLYNVGAGLVRAEGDSTRPLMYLIIGGITNFIVDTVLVAGLGMGVKGAAWATVASQTVTAILVLNRLSRLNPEYAWRPLKMRPEKLAMWDITRISVPCGLSHSMFNIANLIIQTKINSFGAVAMAGAAAYSKIDAFVYMPMSALALALSTYVGQNIGAGLYGRIRKGIRVTVILSVVATAVLSAVIIIAFDPIVHLFTDDAGAVECARVMMWHLIPFVWGYAIGDVIPGAIRGAGQATQVTIILAVTICVCRLVWLRVMLPVYNDIRIVFIAYPISWWLCSIVMLWYYFRRSTVFKSIRNSEKLPA